MFSPKPVQEQEKYFTSISVSISISLSLTPTPIQKFQDISHKSPKTEEAQMMKNRFLDDIHRTYNPSDS